MWFGEPHPFPERGSPTILGMSGLQRYEGWSCIALKTKTDASSPVRKSVAYECGVGRSTGKWLCQSPRNGLVVLLDIALHYFISRINWVNKTTSKTEIIKTVCNSVNRTRFPKEDHLPYWACRDYKVTKGDRVENVLYTPNRHWDDVNKDFRLALLASHPSPLLTSSNTT